MESTQPLFDIPNRTPRRGSRTPAAAPIVFVGSQMARLRQEPPPEQHLVRRELNRPLKVGESIQIKFVDQLVTTSITAFQDVCGARSTCGYRVATLNNRAVPVENGLYCRTINGMGPVPEASARGFARHVARQFMVPGETVRWVVVRGGRTYTRDIVVSDGWA